MADSKWIGCAERNFRRGRPAPHVVEAVVIHIIDGPQSAADSTFLDNTLTNPRSAHYSIGRDGTVHQYVEESDTAFHAGVVLNPTWPALKRMADGRPVNPNFYTIGIEHDGRPNDEWTEPMYAAGAALLREISERYPALENLNESNVVMHRAIRADKSCPGFKIDMKRLIASASLTEPPGLQIPLLITTLVNANIRLGRPSTSSPVDRVLPANSMIHVVTAVQGEPVVGRDGKPNPKWFRTLDGEFLWAGTTDQPV